MSRAKRSYLTTLEVAKVRVRHDPSQPFDTLLTTTDTLRRRYDEDRALWVQRLTGGIPGDTLAMIRQSRTSLTIVSITITAVLSSRTQARVRTALHPHEYDASGPRAGNSEAHSRLSDGVSRASVVSDWTDSASAAVSLDAGDDSADRPVTLFATNYAPYHLPPDTHFVQLDYTTYWLAAQGPASTQTSSHMDSPPGPRRTSVPKRVSESEPQLGPVGALPAARLSADALPHPAASGSATQTPAARRGSHGPRPVGAGPAHVPAPCAYALIRPAVVQVNQAAVIQFLDFVESCYLDSPVDSVDGPVDGRSAAFHDLLQQLSLARTRETIGEVCDEIDRYRDAGELTARDAGAR